jgi:ribonuclease E
MYDKDYEGIIVEGEEGYKEARDFMRMLMPSQVKKVMLHKEPLPLFVRHKVEDQLSQIHSPVVPLKSGGYLVINQTEALVAIDVNSGKSTRERGIEATALKTNLEAADEAARQLRLRDLAGLIVIDFIDMDESKNNRAVEKRLKDALDGDRARLQMGKISPFGLMEISRQRRRTGVLEGTTHVCPSCQGLGRIRSAESSALSALRSVEIEFARDGGGTAVLRVAGPVALYILNEKRAYLTRLEQVQGLHITVINDDTLHHAEHMVERLSSTGAPPAYIEEPSALASAAREESDEFEEDEVEAEDEDEAEAPAAASDESEEARRGRRRRRTRGGRGRSEEARAGGGQADEEDAPVQARESAGPTDEPLSEEERNRRRRRGRRGGRRTREEGRTGAEPYAWTRARSPDGEDPYGWFDPLPPLAHEPAAAAALSEPLVAANDPDEPAPAAVAAVASHEAEATDAGEAPAGRAPRKRSPRGGRGRGRRGAEAADTAPSDEDSASEAPSEATTEAGEAAPQTVEPEPAPQGAEIVDFPVPEPRPEPVTAEAEAAPDPVAAQAPAVEAEAQPASLEAAEPEPAPMAEREPDPAEISAPPVQPRRGWWRRGG